VLGDVMGFTSGPILGRMQAGPLLRGCEVFLAGAFSRHAEVEALLRAAGARLLTRPPVPPPDAGQAARPGAQALALWEPGPGAAAPAAPPGVPVVRLQWLWDSAGSFQVQPFEKYA
jgi:hypothetical protein